LLYEPNTHTVIMVDQFKVPTLIARRRDAAGLSRASLDQVDHALRRLGSRSVKNIWGKMQSVEEISSFGHCVRSGTAQVALFMDG
jgi:hypothetical protein